jgi:hypothetical protein
MSGALVLIFLFLVTTLGKASECGCDQNADLNIRQLVEADLVFKGHVVTKRTEFFPELGYRFVATFFIDKLIGGSVESETVDIEFGYGEAYCSVNFFPRLNYFIVASKDDSFPYHQTNYCSGNRRWENLSRKDQRLLVDFQRGKRELEWRDEFHGVYAKGRLSQKKPVGLWQYFFYKGLIKESGNYVNGKKEGDWFTFYNPVSICFELNLPIEKGVCDLSDLVSPHPAGWISSVTPYKNGKIHGTVLNYRESGCITSEALYENGKMIGLEIRYKLHFTNSTNNST